MNALLAALPIVTILVLMLGFHWPAGRAGLAGLVLTIGLALTVFSFEAVDGDVVVGLGGAFAEAAFTSAIILWIIIPALGIYSLQQRTGAIETLRTGLTSLSSDPRLTGIVVAWFFSLLLEGAAGFGTSAALAAPFLVSLGMRPVAAVTAAMIGHLVGVTFGAVGTPIVPMVAASGLAPVELAASVALTAALVAWAIPFVVARVVAAGFEDDVAVPTGSLWPVAGLAAVAFLVPYLAFGLFVGPELPTLAGAIVGGGVVAWYVRRRSGSVAGADGAVAGDAGPDTGALVRAVSPYLALVAVVLATRLIGPVRDALEAVTLRWEIDGGTFSGSFAPLFHPGSMLFLALLVGAKAQGASGQQLGDALGSTMRKIVPVGAALLAMLSVARIMVQAGMVEEIAVAAADALGGAWPLVAPAVGALGSFVTGSATASNALFSDLQIVTAERVGDPVVTILGAQGAGAAFGNAIAPHNLIAAAAVVGLAGRESEILRRTLPVAAPLIAAAGVVAFALANL